MNVTKKAIIDFLLRRLSSISEDDFLAECFSNDESAEYFESVREELIERYLRGELSKDDTQRFDEYFLKDEHNRELYEFARALRGQLQENSRLVESATAKTAKKAFGFPNIAIPVGAALVMLLLVGGGLIMIFRNSGTQRAGVQPTPAIQPMIEKPPSNPIIPNDTVTAGLTPTPETSPAATPRENLPQQISPSPSLVPQKQLALHVPFRFSFGKGEDTQKMLVIDKNLGFVDFIMPRLDLDVNYSKYQIKILRNKKVLESTIYLKNLHINKNNEVVVPVPAQMLKSGDHELVVFGRTSDKKWEEIEGYRNTFAVQRK